MLINSHLFQFRLTVSPIASLRRIKGRSSLLLVCWAVVLGYALPVLAQPFSISSARLTNGAIQITYPSRSDSYYWLNFSPTLTVPSQPVVPFLGINGSQAFQYPVNRSNGFFRVQQLPLNSANSLLGDGIPDGWKLLHGLNPLGPSVANLPPWGTTNTWRQLYSNDVQYANLPVAYFPQTQATVIAGSSNVSVQVYFSKPYNGLLRYQLSGTAAPTTGSTVNDYTPPSGLVNVVNATNANILINLVPHPAVEIAKTILISLSTSNPPASTLNSNNYNRFYTLGTNASVCQVQIAQSTLGIFSGVLTFSVIQLPIRIRPILGTPAVTNGFLVPAQPVKMALRPVSGGNVGYFDVTGSALFAGTFSVPVNANTNGFQFTSSYMQQYTNTFLGRTLTMTLAFGATQTPDNSSYATPVTLTLNGLTASGLPYVANGLLNLTRVQ